MAVIYVSWAPRSHGPCLLPASVLMQQSAWPRTAQCVGSAGSGNAHCLEAVSELSRKSSSGMKIDVLGFLLLRWNTMAKKQVWEERVCSAYTSRSEPIIGGSQGRNSSRAGSWRQEQMQRLERGAVCWLTCLGLFILLLIELRTTCPVMAHPPWAGTSSIDN